MKRILLYLLIFVVGISITSFVSENSYREIRVLYDLEDTSLDNYLWVSVADDANSSIHYIYDNDNKLIRIQGKNNFVETFQYNSDHQLTQIHRYQDNKLVDFEEIKWNKDKLIKVDYDVFEESVVPVYKEELIRNYSNEITEVQGFIKDDKGNWISSGQQYKIFWENGFLNRIENWNTLNYSAMKKISNNNPVSKIDIYNNIEKENFRIKNTEDGSLQWFSTTYFRYTNITDPKSYFSKGWVVWPGNGVFPDHAKITMIYENRLKNQYTEIHSYRFDASSYPIQVDMSRVKKLGQRLYASNYSKEYSYELNSF